MVEDLTKVLNSALKKTKTFEQVEELVGIILTIDEAKHKIAGIAVKAKRYRQLFDSDCL